MSPTSSATWLMPIARALAELSCVSMLPPSLLSGERGGSGDGSACEKEDDPEAEFVTGAIHDDARNDVSLGSGSSPCLYRGEEGPPCSCSERDSGFRQSRSVTSRRPRSAKRSEGKKC